MYEVLDNLLLHSPNLVEEHLVAPEPVASPYAQLQQFQEEMKDFGLGLGFGRGAQLQAANHESHLGRVW